MLVMAFVTRILSVGFRVEFTLVLGEKDITLSLPCLEALASRSRNSAILTQCSWSKDLAFRRGTAMGGEFKTKGVNVLLGPVVGPAWRIVRGGRNWEGFSVDPWLSGVLVAQTVSGIQGQGVITSTKVSLSHTTTCRSYGKLKWLVLKYWYFAALYWQRTRNQPESRRKYLCRIFQP